MSHRTIALLALMLCLGMAAPPTLAEEPQAAPALPLLSLYYIPFSAETIIGITPKVMRRGKPLLITSPATAAEISGWLAFKAGGGQFHPYSTRLLVVFSDGRPDVLVDQFGYVLAGPLHYRLPLLEMNRLDALLRPMLEARQAAEEQKKENAQPALIRAIHKDNSAVVKQLLEDKADPNSRDNDNDTALMDAAYFGDVRLCELLVSAGADINAEASKHETALGSAIVGEHFSVFQWLLAHGASVKGNIGAAALTDAVNALDDGLGNRMANILLEHHAPVELTDDPHANTALMCVIGSRNPALVAKIIQHGGNANAVDDGGSTPLDWAAVTGDNSAIRLLLAHGARLDQKMNDGTTALTRAVTGARIDTVRLLLSYGAVQDAQTLQEARSLRDPAILRLLQREGRQRHPTRRRLKSTAHFV